MTQPGLLAALNQNQEVVQPGSLPVYECTEYGDGSKVWGPVQRANVFLTGVGGEPAAQVPIQVIGSTTPDVLNGTGKEACANAQSDPTAALYNGSLGIGFFVQDCGNACAASSHNGKYFTCSGGTCSPAAISTGGQVQNPVASLPVDNNGIALLFPGVPSDGSATATGYLVLGIGTQSNNSPSGVVAYGADANGEFTTLFNGVSYPQSFIDSGSNGLYFPDSAIQTCSPWFCPTTSPLPLSATTTGSAGSPSGTVGFQIADAGTLFASGNLVFSDLGGPKPGSFDWGLPFFLGRNVYVGIEGRPSTLGTGPYWGY